MTRPSQFFLDGPIYKAIVEFAEAFGESERHANELAGEIESLIDDYAMERVFENEKEMAEIESLEDDD